MRPKQRNHSAHLLLFGLFYENSNPWVTTFLCFDFADGDPRRNDLLLEPVYGDVELSPSRLNRFDQCPYFYSEVQVLSS